jgi:hypothetical protein
VNKRIAAKGSFKAELAHVTFVDGPLVLRRLVQITSRHDISEVAYIV